MQPLVFVSLLIAHKKICWFVDRFVLLLDHINHNGLWLKFLKTAVTLQAALWKNIPDKKNPLTIHAKSPLRLS